MIKKKLILAVFFSVMLENIVAMDVNGQQQQQNGVVEIDGIRYSQYNAHNYTIEVNGVEHQLELAVPNNVFPIDTRMNFATYLCMYKIEAAEAFGMYNDLLEQEMPIPGLRYLGWIGYGEIKWKDFLMYHAPKIALRMNLYTPENLDRKLSLQFMNGIHEGLSWRELVGLHVFWGYDVMNDNALLSRMSMQIFGPILRDNLSESVMQGVWQIYGESVNIKSFWKNYSAFEDLAKRDMYDLHSNEYEDSSALYRPMDDESESNISDLNNLGLHEKIDYEDGDMLTWWELLCCQKQSIAKSLGLYTDEFLEKTIPEVVVRASGLPSGLNWMGFFCYKYSSVICNKIVHPSERLLDQKVPEQLVNLDPEKYTNLTWRDYLRLYVEPAALEFGLYTIDFLPKIAPDSILEKKGLIAGLTWWEVMCNKHPEQMLNKLDGLNQLKMTQFLQQVYVNSGKNWRNEIIPNSMGALDQVILGETWGQYLSAVRFFQRKGMSVLFEDNF